MALRLLRYALAADIDTGAFDDKVHSLKNSANKHSAMSLAEKLRQEGRQEGVLKSLREAVLEALSLRFIDVPIGLREAILAISDEAKLRGLLRAGIQATSLEAFAAAL